MVQKLPSKEVIVGQKKKSDLEQLADKQDQYKIDVKLVRDSYNENIGNAKRKSLNELVKSRLQSIMERSKSALEAIEKGYDVAGFTDGWLQHYATEIDNAVKEFNMMERTVENVSWAVALELKHQRQGLVKCSHPGCDSLVDKIAFDAKYAYLTDIEKRDISYKPDNKYYCAEHNKISSGSVS